MNRRGFFKTLAAATAGFAILPPATTYNRIWKATKHINPEWVDAPYEMGFIFNPRFFKGNWKFVVDPLPFRFKLKNGIYESVPKAP